MPNLYIGFTLIRISIIYLHLGGQASMVHSETDLRRDQDSNHILKQSKRPLLRLIQIRLIQQYFWTLLSSLASTNQIIAWECMMKTYKPFTVHP